MLYTTEPYSNIRKLLRSLCAVQEKASPRTYKLSTYKSRNVVYSVEGKDKEVYVIDNDVFEVDSGDFCIGVPKEKEIQIKLDKFIANDKSMVVEEVESIDITWTETTGIEFSVGPVYLDGKSIGTLFAFDGLGASSAVSSVLKKFVHIRTFQEAEDIFEKSLINIFSSNKIL